MSNFLPEINISTKCPMQQSVVQLDYMEIFKFLHFRRNSINLPKNRKPSEYKKIVIERSYSVSKSQQQDRKSQLNPVAILELAKAL